MTQSLYDFTMDDIDGKPVPLKEYAGKVVLVVNVASKCGFTPQYKGWRNCFKPTRIGAWWCSAFPPTIFSFKSPAQIQKSCSSVL